MFEAFKRGHVTKRQAVERYLIGSSVTNITTAPGVQKTVPHGLGRVPEAVFLQGIDEECYLSGDTAAAGFDATNIYVKSKGGAVVFTAWVLG